MNYSYGNWLFALLNIILFLFFIKSAFKPRTKTDWTTYKTFGAFIVALFAEMYGFPLTIYLLTSFFGNRFSNIDFSHNSGHLLNDLLGLTGDPHFSFLHILSNVLIIGGLVLIAEAWDIMAPILIWRYIRLGRDEERAMIKKFTGKYTIYQKTTPAYIIIANPQKYERKLLHTV